MHWKIETNWNKKKKNNYSKNFVILRSGKNYLGKTNILQLQTFVTSLDSSCVFYIKIFWNEGWFSISSFTVFFSVPKFHTNIVQCCFLSQVNNVQNTCVTLSVWSLYYHAIYDYKGTKSYHDFIISKHTILFKLLPEVFYCFLHQFQQR